MATPIDQYDPGSYNVTARDISSSNRRGQTFTASEAYQLGMIEARFKNSSPAGGEVITCELYAESGGVPTGSVLSSGTLDASTLTGTDDWYEIEMSPYAIQAATTYVLTFRSNTAGITINLHNSDGYPGENYCYSLNSGSSWTPDPSKDIYFRTYAAVSLGGSSAHLPGFDTWSW